MTTDWNQRVIEGLVQAVVDELGLPGLAVGIVRDDATLYAAAQGVTNLESKHPVSTRTLFRLGSITKVFTATLLMTFVEAGQVNLDDAVGEYLPQFKAFDPEGKITFQHLATHTSGLPMMPPTVTF
ncbi:MAG: beta-lactamase family protein, partial [Anaerolineae bacterium]|nr:beta-lactamase family protein [Anaerolineae bacterium]